MRSAGATGPGVHILSTGNTVGGSTAAARNVISGNINGVLIEEGGSANLVLGNYIGTDPTGTIAIGNGPVFTADVSCYNGTSNNTIGGTTPGARNIISGESFIGVALTIATDTVVLGNYIGTDYTGTVAVGNEIGVFIQQGVGNTIGGADLDARHRSRQLDRGQRRGLRH